MKKTINFGLAALMVFVIGACGGEKSVKIGEQIWMAKNLNDASKGGKCYYDEPQNCKKYGRLYTWDEAIKVCPEGWHLPSSKEWDVLVNFAGGEEVAGKKLKSKKGWRDYGSESGNGTDDYGFSALAGGQGYLGGNFYNTDLYGYWWSSVEKDSDNANYRVMGFNHEEVSWHDSDKEHMFSVRCVKD